eukprot:g376.t1
MTSSSFVPPSDFDSALNFVDPGFGARAAAALDATDVGELQKLFPALTPTELTVVARYHRGDYLALAEELVGLLQKETDQDGLACSAELSKFNCRLLLALCCHQLFLQANLSGPSIASAVVALHDSERLWQQVKQEEKHETETSPSCAGACSWLEIDGEAPYEELKLPRFLAASHQILKELSASFWLAKVAFTWQRSLTEASDRGTGHSATLMRECLGYEEEGVPSVNKERGNIADEIWKREMTVNSLQTEQDAREPYWRRQARAMGIVEWCVRLAWYGKVEKEEIEEFLRFAGELVDFEFKFTGMEGVRRKHQKHSVAQLVVVTRRFAGAGAGSCAGKTRNDHPLALVATTSLDVVVKDGATAAASSCADVVPEPGVASAAAREKNYATSPTSDDAAAGGGGGGGPDEPTRDALTIAKEQAVGTNRPAMLSLDAVNPDNDILEAPRFFKTGQTHTQEVGAGAAPAGVGAAAVEAEDADGWSVSSPLSAVEQCILLAMGHVYYTGETRHESLMLEQLGALADRVLQFDDQHVGAAFTSLRGGNWLTCATGLYFRCKNEYQRVHTKERACLQLQALVEQFDGLDFGKTIFGMACSVEQDEVDGAARRDVEAQQQATAAERLKFVHQAGYPLRHELQREFGYCMMKYGMVLTAFQYFEALKMWPEAVDCLIAADRKKDAVELIKKRLTVCEAERNDGMRCRLLCCLGDIAGDEELLTPEQEVEDEERAAPASPYPFGLEKNSEGYFKAAWELSGGRYTRAGRSLAFFWFRQALKAPSGEQGLNDHSPPRRTSSSPKADLLKRAADYFNAALAINPMYPSAWFSLGCVEMRRENFRDAAHAFSRSADYRRASTRHGGGSVADGMIDEAGAECYGNLAACLVYLNEYTEAKAAISEACRRSMYNYRLWETNLSICLHLKDVFGCCYAVKKLVVDMKREVPVAALGLLVEKVLLDAGECGESAPEQVGGGNVEEGSCTLALSTVGGGAAPPRQPAALSETTTPASGPRSGSASCSAHQAESNAEPQTELLKQKGQTSSTEDVPEVGAPKYSDTAKAAAQKQKRLEKQRKERERLLDTMGQVTAATANVEANVWKLFAFLQIGVGNFEAALESRQKEFRALNAGMWANVETQMLTLKRSCRGDAAGGADADAKLQNANRAEPGPDDTQFGFRLRSLVDNLTAQVDMLTSGSVSDNCETSSREADGLDVAKEKRALSFSVRNVGRKLKQKLEANDFNCEEWRLVFEQKAAAVESLERRLR